MRRVGRARVARRDERGMTIVVVGIAAMMLMTLTALVIDHSFLRNDRRADQKVADAAATAGAYVLDREDGVSACEAALTYLVENTPGADAFDGADCEDDIPEYCDPSTPVGRTVGTAGDYRIEIVHPVPDTDPLMARASALGAPAAPVVYADGSTCQRIGVAIELIRGPSFGTVLGAGEQTTRVHAVAKAGTPTKGQTPINLLILERYDCHAVVAEGQARLKLGAITGRNGEKLPGMLAVDSSGYKDDDPATLGANCGTVSSPNVGTLHLQGTGSLVQADGPPGCPAELTPGTGDGCGIVELYANGVPGPASPLYCLNKAYWPACTSTGTARPHPVRMAERHTRAPFDHRFNCQSGYGAKPWYEKQKIPQCAEASTPGVDADFVDELTNFVGNNGAPSGFTTYTGPCDISAPLDIPEGNTYVPCDVFRVKSTVKFLGGNVVFNGTVDVTSGTGDLTIHACGKEGVNTCTPGTNALTWTGALDDKGRWTAAQNFVESQYSNDAAWVYFRNGGIKKDAQAKVQIYDSTVLFRYGGGIPCSVMCDGTQPSHVMALSGGTGSLIWHAPRTGPFDVLAMWSASPLLHDMGGQANLDMEGVYFAPVARLTYRGNGAQQQVAAQLVTERLTVTGSGTLNVVPNIYRAVIDPEPYKSSIIR